MRERGTQLETRIKRVKKRAIYEKDTRQMQHEKERHI